MVVPADVGDIYLPSVDCLFTSLANVYHDACVGVVLSGMGCDGAQGVVAIHAHGGWTVAQDEESSVIFGMPKTAIETGAVTTVLPLHSISERLIKLQAQTVE
jgi:two-component system chemotaxis response regulator CheB